MKQGTEWVLLIKKTEVRNLVQVYLYYLLLSGKQRFLNDCYEKSFFTFSDWTLLKTIIISTRSEYPQGKNLLWFALKTGFAVESIDFRPHIMFKNCRPVDQPELIPGMQLLLPLTPFDSRSCGSCRVHTIKKMDSPLWTLSKQKRSGSGYMWVQYTYDI